MSAEDNKALVVRLGEELFERGNLDVVEELIHPDFVNHEARQGRPNGPAGMRGTAQWIRETFGEPSFEANQIVAEGDLVVTQVTFRGRLTGELMGRPPTNREFAVQQFHMWRVEDGKVAEHWAVRDDLGLAGQAGLLDPS
jgi:predicted ester cyclase